MPHVLRVHKRRLQEAIYITGIARFRRLTRDQCRSGNNFAGRRFVIYSPQETIWSCKWAPLPARQQEEAHNGLG